MVKNAAMSMESLHNARPEIDYEMGSAFDWANAQRTANSGRVTAHFGDLTDRLIEFIDGSEAVVGCVAWLTHTPILEALGRIPASLVVQKEDFLRPDSGGSTVGWKARIQALYQQVGNGWSRYPFPAPLNGASFAGDTTLDGVRCVGNSNRERVPSAPRMHHKFLVRVDAAPQAIGNSQHIKARGVWTGSFNFSKNAGASFENAVEIVDDQIAGAYLQEFARVMTLSEPLNWTEDWVTPEWRIGT